MQCEHISAETFHGRRGGPKNSFRYGVDYVLEDFSDTPRPGLYSRDRFNLWHLDSRNHGGPRSDGRGVEWFREELAARGFPLAGAQLVLLAQPAFLWWRFSPVSFWIALRDGQPCAFVAEVNSTFGQRHCYFCARPGFEPISAGDRLVADKLMHVSPFQTIAGQYHFNLDMTKTDIRIRILYRNGGEGVVATLAGRRRAASNASLLAAALRRPFGSARVLGLIYWQALKLRIKRAPFLGRQPAPAAPLSDGREATPDASA
ncbi:DUF1365 domain-containing protein [Tropicimonas sp. IMCC6043]|uniref:DUF1365 domain-containing protein n=1 Tax=Tropicimonas sp. IMCC6043 TaxID=2510645 RepID=UPI00101C9779|nr:DUF1365 domain-containing protein [Tropicimonas sp. IMCC6043]RYH09746.1 DUF1365 domain-containing protein [Tropicimonas sp. IMCC6043]